MRWKVEGERGGGVSINFWISWERFFSFLDRTEIGFKISIFGFWRRNDMGVWVSCVQGRVIWLNEGFGEALSEGVVILDLIVDDEFFSLL